MRPRLSAAYKKVAEAGVTLVFMDQPANDLEAGKDYVSVVSADNYGNGVASAHILANSIGKKGKIAALYHDADFFVTEQRYEGFKKTIEEEYPDIQIIAEKGVSDSDLVAQSQQQADAIINQNLIWQACGLPGMCPPKVSWPPPVAPDVTI